MEYRFDAEKAAGACIEWIRNWFDINGKGCNAIVGISGRALRKSARPR